MSDQLTQPHEIGSSSPDHTMLAGIQPPYSFLSGLGPMRNSTRSMVCFPLALRTLPPACGVNTVPSMAAAPRFGATRGVTSVSTT